MGDSAGALSFAVTLRLGGAGFRLDSLRAIELAPRAGTASPPSSDAAAAALNAAAGAAPRSWHACAGDGCVTVVAAGLTTPAAAKDVAGSLALALRAPGAPPLVPRCQWRAASAAESKRALLGALLSSLARDPSVPPANEASPPWLPVFGAELLLAGGLAALQGAAPRASAVRLASLELADGALATAAMQLVVRPALLRLKPLLLPQPLRDEAAAAAPGARVGINPPVRCVLLLGNDGESSSSGSPALHEALCSGYYEAFPGDACAEAAAGAAWRAAHDGAALPSGLAFAEVRRLPPPGTRRAAAEGGFRSDDDDATAFFGDYDADAAPEEGGPTSDASGSGRKMMRNLELIPLPFVHTAGAGEAPTSALRGGSGAAVVAALCGALQARRVLGLGVAVLQRAQEAPPGAGVEAAPTASYDDVAGEPAPPPTRPRGTEKGGFQAASSESSEPFLLSAPPPMFRSAAHFQEEDAALAAARDAQRAAADAREAAAAAETSEDGAAAEETRTATPAEGPWEPPAPVIAAPPAPVPPRPAKAVPAAPKAAAAGAATTTTTATKPAVPVFKPVFAKRAAPATAGVKPGHAAAKAAPKPRKPAAPKPPANAGASLVATTATAAAAAGGDGGGDAAAAAAPAAAPRKRKAAEEIDGAANDAEVERRHAAGEAAKLSVPQLKAYLKAHKAPGGLGGAKPALLERLAAFLNGAPAAPMAPEPAAPTATA